MACLIFFYLISSIMTTVTVSKNALMAVRLAEAFEKAGIKYYGKIDPEKLNPEEYENLSPREMVEKYSRENHVKQINIFLDILKENFRCNRKNESFPMRVKLDRHKIDFFQFTIGLQYLKLADRTGERAQTRYVWRSENTPLYSEAERLFHYIEQMKAYKLDAKARQFIETNVSLGLEKLNEQLNPGDEGERYYQIHRCFCYARQKLNKKVMQHHEIFERELTRDQLLHTEDKQVREQDKDIGEEQEKEAKEEDAPGLIYILNKRIRHQDKHIKLLCKYIKQLEKTIQKTR